MSDDEAQKLPGVREQLAILDALRNPGLAVELARTRAQLRAAEDEIADLRADRKQLRFIRSVISVAQQADVGEDLLWRTDGQQVQVWVDVSDVFSWGGADAEELTPERLPLLAKAFKDLHEQAPSEDHYCVDLYAARIRGMRPQGAAYPKTAGAQALFDACGPEREVGLGNPRRPPVPEQRSEPTPVMTPEQQAAFDARHADRPTPGCDCGHDGMGDAWHARDCEWRAGLAKEQQP